MKQVSNACFCRTSPRKKPSRVKKRSNEEKSYETGFFTFLFSDISSEILWEWTLAHCYLTSYIYDRLDQVSRY